jgi:hypothetical protein
MPNNIAFVDNICWSKIEAALSPEVNMNLAQKGYTRTQAEPGPGKKGWASLILKDSSGNDVVIARGGQAAEDEYLRELQKNVKQTS